MAITTASEATTALVTTANYAVPYNDTLAVTRIEALNFLINTPDDLTNGQNRVRHAANLPIWERQLVEVRAARSANSSSGSRGGVQYGTSNYRGVC